MKILHIIDHMGLGGAQQFLRDILPEFETRVDGEVHICILRNDNNEKLPSISHILNAHSFFCNPLVIFTVMRYIHSHNIDIIHLHLQRSVFVGLVAGVFKKVKTVVHIHRNFQYEPLYFRLLLQLFKRKVAYFVVCSPRLVKQIMHRVNIEGERVVLIYYCINLRKFNRHRYNGSQLRSKHGFSDSDFIIGYFGRLARQKQPWYILKIARNLAKKTDNCKFIIVGKGSYHKKLENMKKNYKLHNTVYFFGYREDIPELMSIIDVGIFTSSFEGFPISAIEMMAMGKPIVAFTIPAFDEIIKDGVNGYLVEMGDVTSFCDKIYHLSHATDTLSKLGEKSIESVQLFDPQRASNKFLELYQKVVHSVS